MGKLWFLCPDYPGPVGGVRKIYRFVDILNEAGMNAHVVHAKRGFRCQWFINRTPVVCANDVVVSACDLLVVPELYSSRLRAVTQGAAHLILNQRPDQTFFGSGWDPTTWTPVLDRNTTVGIVTVSDNALEYLRFAFPDVPVRRIHHGLDARVFQAGPVLKERRKQIAFMPRRRQGDLAHVLRTAEVLGALDGWQLKAIDGVAELEVAEILRSSAVFLALSEREGFGLPPLEAMACGCLVVGFHGEGGKEYMLPHLTRPLDEGDLFGLVKTFVQVLRDWDDRLEEFSTMAARASEFVLREYSREREAREVAAVFSAALVRAGEVPSADGIQLRSRVIAGKAARWRESGQYASEALRNLRRAATALRPGS